MSSTLIFFSGEDCKKRWKSLRDSYFRCKNKMKKGTGSAATKIPKWHLYDRLTFLSVVHRERDSMSNIEEPSQDILSDLTVSNDVLNTTNTEEPTTNTEEQPASSPKQLKNTIYVQKKENAMVMINTLN